MRFPPIFFCCLLLTSCTLRDAIEKTKRINADLVETFNHKDIDTSIGWGTDEEDNVVTITFSKYDMDNKSYKELEDLASRVRERVLKKNPELKKLDNIEVRFTKEAGTDDPQEFVTFKHKNGV